MTSAMKFNTNETYADNSDTKLQGYICTRICRCTMDYQATAVSQLLVHLETRFHVRRALFFMLPNGKSVRRVKPKTFKLELYHWGATTTGYCDY